MRNNRIRVHFNIDEVGMKTSQSGCLGSKGLKSYFWFNYLMLQYEVKNFLITYAFQKIHDIYMNTNNNEFLSSSLILF